MAWLSSISWTSSDTPVLATVLNNIGNDIRTAGANHDMAGYAIANVGGIAFASGGSISTAVLMNYGGSMSSRPAVSASRINGEISGMLTASFDDAGFLRLSAGGGTSAGTKAYIDLSGYSPTADLEDTIVFGTRNVERMRIGPTGKITFANTPVYADNTAAIAGGLTAGMQYRTSTGVRMEVF